MIQKQCVSLGTYSMAYEFFYVDTMQHKIPVHAMLKVLVFQNQFQFHLDLSHAMMVHDFVLCVLHVPVYHLKEI